MMLGIVLVREHRRRVSYILVLKIDSLDGRGKQPTTTRKKHVPHCLPLIQSLQLNFQLRPG